MRCGLNLLRVFRDIYDNVLFEIADEPYFGVLPGCPLQSNAARSFDSPQLLMLESS